MKKYLYFSFIVYIGLLVSNLIIYTLRVYVEAGVLFFSKSIFIDPIKFSLTGGGILYVVNNIFKTVKNKNDNEK